MVVEAFGPSVHQFIEDGIEEIRVQIAEPLNDCFLDFGIGSEMAKCQVLLQQSEQLKITWCEIPAVRRVFQCLYGGRARHFSWPVLSPSYFHFFWLLKKQLAGRNSEPMPKSRKPLFSGSATWTLISSMLVSIIWCTDGPNASTTMVTIWKKDVPVRGAYYPDGGIPVVAGGRMERAYRRGRPLSPGTEMLVQEMGGESDARRLGNYVVVRKVVRPRVRVDPAEEGMTQDGENGPRRTEILYIRSPMREDEEERHYVREGELLRSVSETALNADDLHLRVPRSYRARGMPLQRMEPPQDPAATQ
ncbi:hypothetical protein AVEN_94326-1, partial [Araneus ventricosus]